MAYATIDKVLKGRTFYGEDKTTLLVGTMELSGNAVTTDVLSGYTFNSNSGTKQTGSLILNGTALASDVLSGYTFYNTSGTLITGTRVMNGNALVSDVAQGKSFYTTDGSLKYGTRVPQGLVYVTRPENATQFETIALSTNAKVYGISITHFYGSTLYPDIQHYNGVWFSQYGVTSLTDLSIPAYYATPDTVSHNNLSCRANLSNGSFSIRVGVSYMQPEYTVYYATT